MPSTDAFAPTSHAGATSAHNLRYGDGICCEKQVQKAKNRAGKTSPCNEYKVHLIRTVAGNSVAFPSYGDWRRRLAADLAK